MQNLKTLQNLKLNKVYKINLNECSQAFASLIDKYSSHANTHNKASCKMLKVQLLSKTLLSGTYKINILNNQLASQGMFVASFNLLKDVKFYDA